MVTQTKKRRRKASLHISVDVELSARLRKLAEQMSIPLSHFASMALSRAVIAYEKELDAGRIEADEADGAKRLPLIRGSSCGERCAGGPSSA